MAGISYSNSADPMSSWSSSMRGSEHFPSPFFDMASLAMPENMTSALQWCEYVVQSQDTYRMATERVIAYFLTDVELGAMNSGKPLGDDEKEKWDQLLNERVRILCKIQELDRDRFCYGNGFCSVVVPFKRFLVCQCGNEFPLSVVHDNPIFKFKWSNWRFYATCPGCHRSGEMHTHDLPQNTPDKIFLKMWSPHEMKILHDPLTDQVSYFWNIPESYKKLIRDGRLFHLERVSRDVLDAIRGNKLFEFDPGAIYHMKEPTLSGIENRGWGISRVITNFRQVWYVQVLHRYNEAIALDYVIPFRLITPAARGGSSQAAGQTRDPLLTMNMGDFSGQVRAMLRGRRRNPASWNTLPFPVEYQALGGDAQALAPRELLDQGLETLLNASGTPVELYKGTMQLQTAPVSLRMFEATWHHLVHDNNSFLRWFTQKVSQILNWENVQARHKRVTHADDMQRHMSLLQLMMGGSISQTTGLKALGIDWKDETRLLGDEARYTQEQQAAIQDEMDAEAFGKQVSQGAPTAGAPPGGAPMPPGGAPPPAGGGDPAAAPPPPVSSMIQNNMMPQTPDEMMEAADSLAQQLLGKPDSIKDSELRALKAKNPVLHALVKEKLDQIRGSARTQGGAMLMSQQYGSGGGGGGQ